VVKNIFIVNGEFKLGDFGISADANGPSQISLGTPEYKAVVLQFFCKIGFYPKTHIWLKTEERGSVQTG